MWPGSSCSRTRPARAPTSSRPTRCARSSSSARVNSPCPPTSACSCSTLPTLVARGGKRAAEGARGAALLLPPPALRQRQRAPAHALLTLPEGALRTRPYRDDRSRASGRGRGRDGPAGGGDLRGTAGAGPAAGRTRPGGGGARPLARGLSRVAGDGMAALGAASPFGKDRAEAMFELALLRTLLFGALRASSAAKANRAARKGARRRRPGRRPRTPAHRHRGRRHTPKRPCAATPTPPSRSIASLASRSREAAGMAAEGTRRLRGSLPWRPPCFSSSFACPCSLVSRRIHRQRHPAYSLFQPQLLLPAALHADRLASARSGWTPRSRGG